MLQPSYTIPHQNGILLNECMCKIQDTIACISFIRFEFKEREEFVKKRDSGLRSWQIVWFLWIQWQRVQQTADEITVWYKSFGKAQVINLMNDNGFGTWTNGCEVWYKRNEAGQNKIWYVKNIRGSQHAISFEPKIYLLIFVFCV